MTDASARPRTAISRRHAQLASTSTSNFSSHARPNTYSTKTASEKRATAFASIASPPRSRSARLDVFVFESSSALLTSDSPDKSSTDRDTVASLTSLELASSSFAAFSFPARARAIKSISSALASAISATLRGSGSFATSSWNARTMRSYKSPSTLSRLSRGRHAGVATWRSRPSPFTADFFKTATATSTSVTFTSRWLETIPKIQNSALRATRSAFALKSLTQPFLTRMMQRLPIR